MELNEFKSKAEELLKKLDKTNVYPADGLSKSDKEKGIETDILMDFTNLVHAFDNNHPIKKVLFDSFSYNFTKRGLDSEEKRVLNYCIKKFQTYLDLPS